MNFVGDHGALSWYVPQTTIKSYATDINSSNSSAPASPLFLDQTQNGSCCALLLMLNWGPNRITQIQNRSVKEWKVRTQEFRICWFKILWVDWSSSCVIGLNDDSTSLSCQLVLSHWAWRIEGSSLSAIFQISQYNTNHDQLYVCHICCTCRTLYLLTQCVSTRPGSW